MTRGTLLGDRRGPVPDASWSSPRTTSDYCIANTVGPSTWSVRGPGTPAPSYVANGTCS